ncbi:MAG: hydrogenase maturation nickel metallochaperone HypA [Candidatus Latescibacterota bacterium]|nr:MAG: hydrogenase maturation nickel metallochaperone HypA [Candidatus Latescibacterota bacterium]
MHEASVARTILEIAERTGARHGEVRIVRVHVVVGALAHIDDDALRFAFDALKTDTACASASLEIDKKRLVGSCRACDFSFEAEIPSDSCPQCGGAELSWSGDQESYVTAIDVDDEPAAGGRPREGG